MSLVSVIIPSYNREKTLPRTLDSVLKQTHQNIEVLVIDDASTDQTEQMLLRDYNDTRISYHKFTTNQGVHAARNKGLEKSKGEYVVFLDSDDEIAQDAIETGLSVFIKEENIGLFAAPFKVNNTNILTGIDRNYSGFVTFNVFLCGNQLRKNKNSFVMLRRSAIGDIRFVMKNLDFIFYRKVGSRTKIYFHAEALGIYHLDENANSMTKKRKTPDAMLSVKRAKALEDFLDEFGERLIKNCPHMYSNYAYGASVGLLLNNEINKARHFADYAARYANRTDYTIFSIFTKLPYSNFLLMLLFRLKTWYKKVF
jgi:glycosyltransferase involved in cell wall biosynthesis